MQITTFGIMIMGGQIVSWLGSFPKDKVKQSSDGKQVFTLQVDKICCLSNVTWFYFAFKGEKDGLPRYKTQ
jgi:hypothetical protein